MLHQTLVRIQPEGYLYSYNNQNDCFIGVQSIDDNLNQYRLGTIFLRNFYVGLDYNYEQIVIGLNEGTTYASIMGSSPNPNFKSEKDKGAVVFVLMFLIFMFGIAITFYFRSRQQEK